MIALTALAAKDHDDWLALWRGYLEFYGGALADAVTHATFERLVAGDGMHGAIARDLFVAPDARGGGVGRALIAHVRDWAVGEGCAKVYWLTREDNATARALYDRVAAATGFVHYQIALA